MKPWIEHYATRGVGELAISSSGNSAISAAKFCDELGMKLNVFVAVNINENKLSRIKSYRNIALYLTKTPNKDVFRFCKKSNIPNLRASKDDAALEGYQEIAHELREQLPHIDNIFVPTSSGATLEGIYLGYKSQTPGIKSQPPAFFVVQTTKVHPIANYFDKDFSPENTSYATAIVDRIAHRRDRIIEIVKETKGGGFVISNKDLEGARALLISADFKPMIADSTIRENQLSSADINSRAQLGWHSALAFAGFLKWQRQNSAIAANKISVCIFTD